MGQVLPGVQKQYTGFQNWTSPCFMYVHGSSLLIFLKRHLLGFLFEKYSVWKLKKRLWFQKICNFKQTPLGLFLKKFFFYFGMKLKWGINIIIFACQQINMSIEWMSEDSIFTVKVEQYLMRAKRKSLRKKQKTFILFMIHVCMFWGREKKTKNSFYLLVVRPDECFFPWCTIFSSPHWDNSGIIYPQNYYKYQTNRLFYMIYEYKINKMCLWNTNAPR